MMLDYVKRLAIIGPRLLENETKALEMLEDILKRNQIDFVLQPFKTFEPKIISASLTADNKSIDCLGSGLVSGSIPDGRLLLDTMAAYPENVPYAICFSPITDEISVIDILRVPAICISRRSVVDINMAKVVKGSIVVEKAAVNSGNILCGNTTNPKTIIFAHFDSIIGQGALDNAGAVAVILEMVIKQPDILMNNLLVFSGNEEVSYDGYKTKSGYGFRVFETEYGQLLESCKKVIVIDGIGVGLPSFSQNGLDWVLQVKMLDKIRDKVFWLQNDQNEVLKYFHTKADTVENLSEKFLQQAYNELVILLGHN